MGEEEEEEEEEKKKFKQGQKGMEIMDFSMILV